MEECEASDHAKYHGSIRNMDMILRTVGGHWTLVNRIMIGNIGASETCYWKQSGNRAWVKVKSVSRVRLSVTPWTAAYQASWSMGFSRQEYWSGLPFHSLRNRV